MPLSVVAWKLDVDLKGLTSFKIGGRAPFFLSAGDSGGLRSALRDCQGDCYFLGGGSNLLVADSRLKKPVLTLGEAFSYIKPAKDGSLEVGAATRLCELTAYCCKNGLAGLEGLAGIPACVGGLLAMNAAGFGSQISDQLVKLAALDKAGRETVLNKADIKWGYRYCSAASCFITKVWFKFLPDAGVKEKTAETLRKRVAAQDYDFPSCGCVFKNPPADSAGQACLPAGRLIDACGLKGIKRGGAMISNKHANFIVNTGNASYDDVDYLISLAKEKVAVKFSVELEEEIKRWT